MTFKKPSMKTQKMIILNSPNNPAGTLIKDDLMKQLIDLCAPHHIYIMCDEIYKGPDQNGYRICQ